MNPLKILDRLLSEIGVAAKWDDSRFGSIKMIGAADARQVGEEFAARMLRGLEYAAEQNPKKLGKWDIRANGKTLAVKCATEDVAGCFQFNRIRRDACCDLLLVIGVAPETARFRFYKRDELMDLKMPPMMMKTAGHKLSRHRTQLLPIDKFAEESAKHLGAPTAASPR